MIILLLRLLGLAFFIWCGLGITHKLYRAYRTWRDFNPRPAEDSMVSCAYCGLYLPPDLALKLDERYFCTPAHLAAAVKRDNTT